MGLSPLHQKSCNTRLQISFKESGRVYKAKVKSSPKVSGSQLQKHVVLDLGSETEMDKSKFAVFDLMRQRWARDKSTREMGKRWTRAHLEPFCSWPDCSSLSKEPDGHQ